MSYFLDFSNLTNDDIKEIKHSMSAFSISFQKAMGKFMNDNPGKIKVLGEIKNGEIIRDEIGMNGVREYKGNDAIKRILDEALKNKRKKKND